MTFKPGAFNHAHQASTRIPATRDDEAETPAQRNKRVRSYLAAKACPDMPGATLDERKAQIAVWLETPEAVEPLADLTLLLSVLGLDDKTDAPPSPVQLIAPDTAKAPGPRPKWATAYPDDARED